MAKIGDFLVAIHTASAGAVDVRNDELGWSRTAGTHDLASPAGEGHG